MRLEIPDISKQIYQENILNILTSEYSTIGTIWVTHQIEWCNRNYLMFKDHDKALIIIYLLKKTLDFYSKNFVKLSYQEYFFKDFVEIEKFSISEISKALNIPKETTRRKLFELEKKNIIKKNPTCCIDRTALPFIRPDDSIKKISNFLCLFSKLLLDKKILLNSFTSEELKKIIEKDFTYIWKIYYDMQIEMMLSYKNVFKNYESYHIFGACVVNQHLYSNKINEYKMNRENYIKSIYSNENVVGVNAMSLSDITNIPRATVIRKLKNLLKLNYLSIDKKKHYTISGNLVKRLVPLQNEVLTNLANFSSIIYNSAILYFNKNL